MTLEDFQDRQMGAANGLGEPLMAIVEGVENVWSVRWVAVVILLLRKMSSVSALEMDMGVTLS
jgi:hypothetical protein